MRDSGHFSLLWNMITLKKSLIRGHNLLFSSKQGVAASQVFHGEISISKCYRNKKNTTNHQHTRHKEGYVGLLCRFIMRKKAALFTRTPHLVFPGKEMLDS